MSDFVCPLSERKVSDKDILDLDDDPLEGLPVGWIRITVERRVLNPEWVELQEIKEMINLGQIAQTIPDKMPDGSEIPAERRQLAEKAIRWSTRALFSNADQIVPQYLIEEEPVYIFPPDQDAGVAGAWAEIAVKLKTTIGLPEEAPVAESATAPVKA